MQQPLKLDPENSFFDEVMGWTIAAGGAYYQVSKAFQWSDVCLVPSRMLSCSRGVETGGKL